VPRLAANLPGHNLGVTALAWNLNATWLVSGGADGTVEFWETWLALGAARNKHISVPSGLMMRERQVL
jgi:hypothetical protein